jgi:hypothetical protein
MSTIELSVPLEPRGLVMTETARAFRRPDGAALCRASSAIAARPAQTHTILSNAALVEVFWEPLLVRPLEQRRAAGQEPP